MNLATVMTQIGTQLDTITGLRVFDYPPGTVTPPAAIVAYPGTLDFDQTYARGADRMDLSVTVVVGKASDRTARDRLGEYCNGSGAKSIKSVLEAGTYTAFDSVRVTSIEFDVVSIGGADCVAATFDLDVTGHGS